jgi:hypothetical protein
MKHKHAAVYAALMAFCGSAESASMTCPLQAAMAKHVAERALKEALQEPSLIAQSGVFDTWMTFLNALMQPYKQRPEDRGFVTNVALGGASLFDMKQQITATVAPAAFPRLFETAIRRSCEVYGADANPNVLLKPWTGVPGTIQNDSPSEGSRVIESKN